MTWAGLGWVALVVAGLLVAALLPFRLYLPFVFVWALSLHEYLRRTLR